MKKSIFSVASFLAYVGGLLAAKNKIGSIFEEGIVYILNKFQLPQSTISDYRADFSWMIVFVFIFIGIRFYWHAEHIDNNESFFNFVRRQKNGVKLDFSLRTLWIIIALSFPIVCSSNLAGGDIETVITLCVMFSLMYISMYVWSYCYLDALVDSSVSLSSNNKFLISTIDSISLTAFTLLPIFSGILVWLGVSIEIVYLSFIFPAVIAASLTIFQLIIFVPLYFFSR